MKIAVCGKGGTGKSTVVALLSNEFKSIGLRVIVIDSDESNSGLYWMLGLDKQPNPLMDFVGGKKDIQGKMLARFGSGQSEPEMSILRRDDIHMEDIPADYMAEGDGKRLITIGKIKQSLEGCACPMGVLSREFLGKLRLSRDEIVIADMEAGIEHFGRGLETSINAVIAVIEPSLESINLAEKINDLTFDAGANFAGVVINKVGSDDTYFNLKGELEKRGLPLLGKIPFSKEIIEVCLKGRPMELAYNGGEAAEITKKLQSILGLDN
jgi:CO dehydrogenase maturation factor